MNGVSTDLYAYDGDHVELSDCHYHNCGYEPKSECKDTQDKPDRAEVSYLNWLWYTGYSWCFLSKKAQNIKKTPCRQKVISVTFQLWEKQCNCGDSEEYKGVVQLLEDMQNPKETTTLEAPSLKIPLCLGTLISEYHILTSKLCFGTIDENGEFQQTGSIFENYLIKFWIFY